MYRRQVNSALSCLGVPYRHVAPMFREAIEALGYAARASAEEVAVVVASHLPVAGGVRIDRRVLDDWIFRKRVQPLVEPFATAIRKLAGG
jgi:hypothetical protein